MISLGIESTAHTFGVAILDDKKVLSNVKDVFTTKKGGMIPVKLGEHHIEVCDKILNEAVSKAKIKLEDIDIISFPIDEQDKN